MSRVSARNHHWLLVVALAVTGLSIRTAVTSVGAALDDIQNGLHASAAVAGLITTLPVICFAGLGAATPRASRALGAHRTLVLALLLSAIGMAVRPLGDSAAWFTVGSVLALTGGAVGNVLLPSLVKQHFPDRIGAMTALYTTALAVGTSAAAGFTVPIGDAAHSWRLGIASWAVLAVAAAIPWLPTLRRDTGSAGATEPVVSLRTLARSRTAWALTVFFAAQSIQAYIGFGWFARFLVDHGITHATAGAMVALLTAVGIPVSLIAPRVPPARQRYLVMFFGLCSLVAYVGLAAAPVAGAWLWMVLVGIGYGMFPVSLLLIALRTRSGAMTAALSAFVQVIGYVVAGCGPLMFGALFGATGSWALPLGVLFVALAFSVAAGWPATADRYVDDELAASRT
jgi:CP family cyanate transporter-like MFS transporter